MLNLCLDCECVQVFIFRGDIDVNGNGRDTYNFRAIHLTMENHLRKISTKSEYKSLRL